MLPPKPPPPNTSPLLPHPTTLNPTPRTPQPLLHAPHSKCYTSHFTPHILHPTPHIPHPTPRTPPFTPRTPPFKPHPPNPSHLVSPRLSSRLAPRSQHPPPPLPGGGRPPLQRAAPDQHASSRGAAPPWRPRPSPPRPLHASGPTGTPSNTPNRAQGLWRRW